MANVVAHGKITIYADDTTLYTSGNYLISKQLTEDLIAIKATNWVFHAGRVCHVWCNF